MASYLKKYRHINGIKSKMLTLVDVMCPVCHEIIIEPVVMPCSHGVCLECFEATVEKSNLCCPMCRKRLGSWLRSATKGKQLVNVKFWEQIKSSFPDHVNAKLNGSESTDDVLFNDNRTPRMISSQGEIRKEYEKTLEELRREEEEAKKKQEAATLELIKKMQEEEKLLQEEELSRTLVDEQLAKELEELETTEISPQGKENKTAERKKGPMDQFLMANRSLSNLSDCSHDSIVQETHNFFRPVKAYPKTPPKKLPGGRLQEVQLVRATPRNLTQVLASVDDSKSITGLFRTKTHLNLVLDRLRGGQAHSSAFSGCQLMTSSQEYETPTKKARTLPHTVTSVDDCSSPMETDDSLPGCSGVKQAPSVFFEPLASPDVLAPQLSLVELENQRRAEQLLEQEKADLELAWQLQREFDANNRMVDRRKGSSRAYELRANKSNSQTNRTKRVNPAFRDKGQTTLEEAFRSSRRFAVKWHTS